MTQPIYLDNHATTPLDPRVLESMMPYFCNEFGNPSSRSHIYGWRAEEAVESAREKVAALIGAEPHEIVFTSGATESNNMVIKGICCFTLTCMAEHKSILRPCEWVNAQKYRVLKAKIDSTGRLDISHFADKVKMFPELTSIMAANNEVGTVQPLDEICRLVWSTSKYHGRPMRIHSDLAQAAGKIPINVTNIGGTGISFASLSAHKMYGPKGIGALYVRSSDWEKIPALVHGGGQERGMRSGTLNVPAIVGFGKACEIAMAEMSSEIKRTAFLRDRMEEILLNEIPGLIIHKAEERLSGNLHIALPCDDMDMFMSVLGEHVAISFGSACMSSSGHRSHVLESMGISADEINRSVRIGIGRFNTEAEIDLASEKIVWAFKVANSTGEW